MFGLFVNLILAHFLCDFALQNDKMAVEKCPGWDATLPWYWWLISHAGTHGLAVSLLTGVPILGLFELVLHAVIDYSKCRFRLSLTLDQLLHAFCKMAWALLAFRVFAV